MDIIVDDLCLKIRRYEADLRAMQAAGRGPGDQQFAEAERNLNLCRQWLQLLGAEGKLDREAPAARPVAGWKPAATQSKFAA